MKIKRFAYWVTAFTLLLLTYWFGFFRKPVEKQTDIKKVPVEIKTVDTNSIQETIELTGWIKASKLVDIRSKVQGRIESLQSILKNGNLVQVEEGLTVKKDQQLAVIDHDVYLANVAAAKATVKAAQVKLEEAQREKKRIVALYQSGSATEMSRDKAVTTVELAAANLDSAKAALQLAQINLTESTITSPIDGIVTAKHIDQGNLIKIGDRIVTVADARTVKVIVAAAGQYAGQITAGTPVEIQIDAYPDKMFEARVYSVYPALDPETHTIQVEIRLQNENLLLKPGMFARVTIITQQKENVVVIPRDVILGGKINEPYVYVVKDAVAHKRLVKVGITQADRYEIIEGLKPGQNLVFNGMNYLTDGIGVEVVRIEDIK